MDFVKPDRIVSSRVDPEKRVLPVVCKLNLNRMITFRTTGPLWAEDGFGAVAVATYAFKNQPSSLVARDSRRTASLAEGSHILIPDLLVSTT